MIPRAVAIALRAMCSVRWLVISACTGICSAAHAQLPPPGVFNRLDIPDLPVSTVHSLCFDNDGFLWIGLSDGLCRYDGVNVDVFRRDPRNAASLPHNTITRLLLLQDGRLLVGTGNGLALLDPRSFSFTRIAIPAPFQRETYASVMCLAEDLNGSVLVSALEYGLLRFNPKDTTLERVFPLRITAANDEHLRGILVDNDGTLWAANRDVLLHMDPKLHAAERHVFKDGPPNAAPHPLLMDIVADPADRDRLIITSWGSGMVCFNKRTKAFTQTKLPSDKPWNLSNITFEALPLPAGSVLTSIDWRMRWYDPRSNRLGTPFLMSETNPKEFGDCINTTITSADGWIWAGGSGSIYLMRDPQYQQLHRFGMLENQSSLTYALARDHSGYWAARYYEYRKLFACDTNGVAYDSIPLPDGDRLQCEVWDIASTPEGLVYLETSRGLWQYHPTTRTFTSIPMQLPGDQGLVQQGIDGLVAVADGSVWLTSLWGAYRSAGGGAPFLPVGRDSTRMDQWIPSGGGDGCQLDPDHLVFGIVGWGIVVVNIHDLTTARISFDDPRAPELEDLVDITVRPGGWIDAITRSNGVVSLRYADGAFADVSVHHELQAQETYFAGCTDPTGSVWIGSTASVVRFEPSTGTFTRLGQDEGFTIVGAEAIMSDGKGGLLVRNGPWWRFDPASITNTSRPHGIYIRSVRAQGELVRSFPDTAAMRSAYDHNTISIEYAPIDPLRGKVHRYQIQLQGQDAKWVDNGTQRTASYIALPPGDYTFRVRISGEVGDPPTTAFHFTIVPAFWQTWWFKVLVLLVTAVLIFLLSRYILRLQYQRRIAALERERAVGAVRTRIARDIHDDIGSGLTKITMLSREMGANGDKEKLAKSIATASTDLIGQLSEIVWTNDPTNDQAPRFVAYVRNMLGKQFEELSVELHTDLRVETGAEMLMLGPEVKRNVVLILKEAVSNALKYAEAKSITVQLVISVTALRLSVLDDGRGFDVNAKAAAGNGLPNMRKRAISIGAKYSCTSGTQGTRVELRVPFAPSTNM